MEQKEVLAMRYILDGSESGCLSRNELLTSDEIKNKNEKHFRNLFLAFYKKYHSQKNLGFVFTITYLDKKGKLKVEFFNRENLENIDKDFIIRDCSIFMVYNKDEKTEEYFINNSVVSSAELLKKDYKKVSEKELKRERNVKKINLGKQNEDSKKKLKASEDKKLANIKNNKNVTRVHKKQSSSIMSFFGKK